jgi:hypothetical protein
MKLLLLAVMMAIVAGCSAPDPYEQNIEGIMLKSGEPLANVKVRFLTEYPEDTCEGQGLETTTDESGKFSLKQLYKPSKVEDYAVVIHPYRLCMSTGGHWKTIWKLKTGPAPKKIAFRCELDEKGNAVCKVAWDGQGYR